MTDALAKLLEVIATAMPREEVEAVWAFPPVRREGREHGVAVVSRVLEGDRRRVYRARYALGLGGSARGAVTVEIEPAAEGPPSLVPSVIEGVRDRADEAGDAERLDLTEWKASGHEHASGD